MTQQEQYDAVVVGARCAGSSLALRLARSGWRVAVVDAARFPSDTVSTHVMFPDSLELLDRLGVLAVLEARHRLTPVRFSWRVLGQGVAGSFTPVGGRGRCLSVRRLALDAALVDTATEAGAVLHEGRRVVDVLGAGTPDDPARGVVLDDGTELLAPWVVGADGQRSTVARRLRLPTTEDRRGELAFLLAYWDGLPAADWCILDNHERSALMSVPVEDGLHLLSLAGQPELTRGGPAELAARYEAGLLGFPATLNPRLLAPARRVTPVVAVPETMMRGHARPASGPGWALVGDAGRLKHPSTAQGIGDALHQAEHVAEELLAGGDLSGFGAWRDARAAGHDAWSFQAARLPRPEDAGLYAGIAADPAARQGFLDTFTKGTRISDVVTPARMARWRLATAYDDGVQRLSRLLHEASPDRLARTVPACPAWTVRDLLAHLAGVAADAAVGGFFPGALDAWRDEELAARRERWTAGHVESRAGADADELLAAIRRDGERVVRSLRSGEGPAVRVSRWMVGAPVADLAAHLDDLGEALGTAPHRDALVTRTGFDLYRQWLGARLDLLGMPGLRLTDGSHEWVVGGRAPGATVAGDRHELFRTIAGRRSADAVRALRWSGPVEKYLPLIAPYPLPAEVRAAQSVQRRTDSRRPPVGGAAR